MVLTVGQNRQFEHVAILHGAAQQAGIHDWHAVVRQGHNPGLVHPPNLGQFLTGQAHRHCTNRQETGATYRRRPPQHKLRDGWRIIHWFGIRHRCHGSKTSCSRGCQASGDHFLMLKARLTEMDMHVKEARSYDTALGFDDAWQRARVALGTLYRGTKVRTQFSNFTVHDPHVHMSIDPLRWINDTSATNQDVHPNSLPGADTAAPCVRPRRWSPGPESLTQSHRPPPAQSPPRDSSAPDASRARQTWHAGDVR